MRQCTNLRLGGRKDSADTWQEFLERFKTRGAAGKWESWCLLTKEQQVYFSKRFGIDPPEPVRRQGRYQKRS